MVRTASQMVPLGTKAPDFSLPATDGSTVTLGDSAEAKALVVVFMCNHCPYVKHIRSELAGFVNTWQEKGVAFVGINSNDIEAYPDDDMDAMRQEVKAVGYTFPYLLDEDQSVAKAYHAACTPDFFVFDKDRKLVYRGQFDGARPGNDQPVTGADLAAALHATLAGDGPLEKQVPSMGCNIKWKPGNAPDWFQA